VPAPRADAGQAPLSAAVVSTDVPQRRRVLRACVRWRRGEPSV